jgi:UDP-N-acetylglucosamine transferase subunit ALG13
VIFVTVGAQMPFDRLIGWADAWAGRTGRTDVVAQIGPSQLRPQHLRATRFLDPPEFRRQLQEARAIVSHAGMGTILDALVLGRPLLVVPRLGRLAETRNDHQVATARRFAEEGLVRAACSEEAFAAEMDQLEARGSKPRIGASAQESLLARIRSFALAARG